MRTLIHSFQSEWLKRRHSAAAWLVLIGSLFIPALVLINRLWYIHQCYRENSSPDIWKLLFNRNWTVMGMMLLPMGVILITGLITQLEYKNNTWKQIHTLPQKLSSIFFGKLGVLLFMLLQFFVLFNIGIVLCAVVPALVYRGVPFPHVPFPLVFFLKRNAQFFIDALPILALQFLLGLRFKNFFISLGAGLGLFIASMVALNWKFGYLIPYTYCALNFPFQRETIGPEIRTHFWAVGYFVCFTIAGYLMYVGKKDKG
jgi:hypothetical protein